MSKAFTLIELLVVISIIVLITALTLPNYRLGDKQLALQRSAHKIAQDLRRVQEYAISAKEFEGVVPSGYGAYFDLDQPTLYLLFADLNGDQAYSGLSEKVEETSLENNVVLSKLNPEAPGSSLTIVFLPPDPSIVFYPDAASSVITLKAQGTEAPATQYVYNLTRTAPGWLSPRAACDTSSYTVDCPSSFSAQQSDPTYVYDRYRLVTSFSKRFTKTQNPGVTALEKSVEVNKSGLIAVE